MTGRFGLSIRATESRDAPGLAALFEAAGLAVSTAQATARLADLQAEAGSVLIADEWGPPSGVIALHWHTVLTSAYMVAFVSTLCVDPERRRSGVARLLLKAGAQAARAAGCGDLVIAAEPDSSTYAFGVATGFSAVGSQLHRSLRKRG